VTYICLKDKNMTLNELYAIILNRRDHPTEKSYTAALFAQGLPRLAQKVGEEGTEVVVAALAQENARLIEEIADLTFHTLVLMAVKGITPEDVLAELERRHR
jgi:phosphoribosyl-ATP pyrophosphohydrolase